MAGSVVLISNPIATKASARKVELACRFLESRGYEVEAAYTRQRGDAEVIAREAVKRSPSLIIAGGGDGTFNEVMNGLVGSGIPMAILPLGTTNVLAKELDIPEDVEGAMEIATGGTPKLISLGRIDIPGGPSSTSRYFCLMAGVGFDGEAVRRVNAGLKRGLGKGAYIYSGIKTLLKFSPSELTFRVDGEVLSGYSAIIGNAAKYGGNLSATPDARIADPVLYACIFKGSKGADVLRYVFGIAAKRHLKYKDVVYLRAERIEIEGSAHIQVDGDYLGMTPARIEIVPGALRLVF